MAGDPNKNGSFNKIVIAVMGSISLFSAGWAASATTAWLDVRRIDIQGSQKTQQLEARVAKVETTMEVCLKQIQEQLKEINQELKSR